jgi:hypothetical protein
VPVYRVSSITGWALVSTAHFTAHFTLRGRRERDAAKRASDSASAENRTFCMALAARSLRNPSDAEHNPKSHQRPLSLEPAKRNVTCTVKSHFVGWPSRIVG